MTILTHALKAKAPPVDDDQEDEWVRRSRKGDLDAFDLLVDRHYERTFNVTFRVLGCREAAEDATQEVFLKAWQNLSRFKSRSRFSTWLHTIAVRHALDVSRSVKSRPPHTSTPEDLDDVPGGAVFPNGAGTLSPSTEWDRRLAVRDALMNLPDPLREVVSLYYFAGHTLQEIANALNLPLATVYQRLRNGIHRLEKCLRDWETER